MNKLCGFTLLFWGLFSCSTQDNITKDTLINGLSEKDIINKLHSPTRESILAINKYYNFFEYQSDLYLIAQSLNEEDTVYVKEMYWEHEKNNQVVWLLKKKDTWIVIDNLAWSKKIQF